MNDINDQDSIKCIDDDIRANPDKIRYDLR